MQPFVSLALVLALTGLALGAPAFENNLEIRGVSVDEPITVILDNILNQIQIPTTSSHSSSKSLSSKTITSPTVYNFILSSRDNH